VMNYARKFGAMHGTQGRAQDLKGGYSKFQMM